MNNTNSKEYWNEYVTYWENKIKEANSGDGSKDKTNSDEVLEYFFKQMKIEKNDKILDYGCGSGRLFSIYNNIVGMDGYYGIDIARVCLEHAEKSYKSLNIGENLFEFDGMMIPFKDNSFDKIICFGVLDACNQENTIKELLRVLKIGGSCLVTGKNNNYFIDDVEAMTAEINSRKKGHPNYFTDVCKLLKQLKKMQIDVTDSYYFARRGDFPKLKYEKEKGDFFYEWALVLKKTNKSIVFDMDKFSDIYSKTYKEIKKRSIS